MPFPYDRKFGIAPVHDLSPRIVNYLNNQLDLPPSLTIQVPEREATYLEQRSSILNYLEFRKFDDAVVEEVRSADSHYQLVLTGSPSTFLSEAMFHETGGTYYVPFRSLYSRSIDNLMMAGRCFSCSHIGLAGPRVMKTCGQMGIATGYAAALCGKHRVTPRELGQKHIEELRRLIGYV